MIIRSQQTNTGHLRSAFTLVELLVVITIIVIILSMTLATIKFTNDSDRVTAGANKVQSFLAGARDRAIYAKERRGVRLFVEPAPPGSGLGPSPFGRTVTSMAYIAPGGKWGAPEQSSLIDLMRIDGNVFDENPKRVSVPGVDADGDFEDPLDLLIKVRGHNNPGWWNLKRRGWLVDGLRIRIPAGPTGNWYSVNTSLIDITVAPTNNQFLLLEIPYADSGNRGQQVAWTGLTYELELPARVLPSEPGLLVDSVAIDLDGSQIPSIWRPTITGNSMYSGFMDIWFSPRGNVIGDAAAAGKLHFYVCDSEDSLFLKEQMVAQIGLSTFDAGIANGVPFIPMDELDASILAWLTWDGKYLVKDRRVVTLFAQTGALSVSHVDAFVETGNDSFDPLDVDSDTITREPDGLADDPYRFAETGEEAK